MSNQNKFQHFSLFLKALWQHPKTLGALVPSSKVLAQRMSEEVMKSAPQKILELGPGTGIITEALLNQGFLAEQLILVEQSHLFTTHLCEYFPKVKIIEGDAAFLAELLGEDSGALDMVVSSLPLRALPLDLVYQIMSEVYSVLKPNGLFIQYTYHLFSKEKAPYQRDFELLRSSFIFSNLPPAKIEVFKKRGEALSL